MDLQAKVAVAYVKIVIKTSDWNTDYLKVANKSTLWLRVCGVVVASAQALIKKVTSVSEQF